MSSSEAIRLTVAATMETNHDLAVRYLRRAIDEDPDAVLPRFQLGTILGSRGLYAQAAEVLRACISGTESDDPGVIFLLARQLHLAGDLDAINYYRRALALDPACEKAHLYIAQLLASGSDCNVHDAAEHARSALRLRPMNSMVPECEFVETYRMAVGTEVSVADPDRDDSWFEGQAIGQLLLLHPRVSNVLEEAGITCAECAGYSSATLSAAASEVGASLSSLVQKIKMLVTCSDMETVR